MWKQDPRGQALVLACLLLFILCLGVLTTVQLGHTVEERIRLQNTADAAAYSTAAMEARAFNFYAFANRTQASHHVSAMLFQSVLSFLYFGEAFLTDVYGVALTISPCAGSREGLWKVACPALEALPYVGPALRLLNQIFGIFQRLVWTYQRVLRASAADEVIGKGVIPGLRTLSSGMAVLSTTVMEAALAQVATTSAGVIAAHDPGLETNTGQVLAGGLSACQFDRAHMREANGSPLSPNLAPGRPLAPRERREDSKTARAKRAMAQVANASRYACDGEQGCPERFITSRRPGDLWSLPEGLRPLAGFLNHLPKWGQTRFLSYNLGRGWEDPEGSNFIREPLDVPGKPASMLAQGDNLGSDDLYEIGLGGALGGVFNSVFCPSGGHPWECWGDARRGHKDATGQRPFRHMLKTSIWATNDDESHGAPGGIHWRIAHADGYPAGRGHVEPSAPRGEPEWEMGLNRFLRKVGPISIAVYVANVRPIEDGNHRWPGLPPFPHFEPGDYAEACQPLPARSGEPSLTRAAQREDDFNQPSVWVALGKRLDSPVSGNRPGRVAPGLNVLARAQTYYHRPGAWAEQPNFFNPYWRPRLASVYQGRSSFPRFKQTLDALPGPFAGAAQKLVTH